ENYRFREALKEAMDLARLGNKYLADTEPWIVIKSDKNRVKTILNISLQIAANLTILLEPFLPFTTEKLRNFINFSGKDWELIGRKNLLPAGHQINPSSLLFEKIEDEAIEKQINKLQETKKENKEMEYVFPPQKKNISFDEFTRLDIRSGTIIEAKKVPKTQKLIKLKIDTGLDQRTVVSGIAEFFDSENIIGKQVSVVLNLAPRTIKGIESNGMILMAEDPDSKLVFVSPLEKIRNGSEIK
ncbi:MAG: class I tRNA ligase family protein, partial [Bacteroidales bacterium]|nr:class I tRNA ligase family protein [Bacteroidales bacterium]